MTYNSILDTWFGTPLLSYLLPLLIVLLTAIYIAIQKKKGKKYSILFQVAIYAIPIIMFLMAAVINPLFIGYGRPVAIIDVKHGGSKVYVCDYILTTGSKTSSGQKCYRLHVLNSTSGEKLVRFPIGDIPNLIFAQGDSVSVYHSSDITIYSSITGKKLVEYSKETLPNLFPELKSGIDYFSVSDYNGIITFQTLDGKKWILNIITHSLKPASDLKNESHHLTNAYFINHENILIDSKAGGEYYIELKNKDENERQKYIFHKKKLWFSDTYFIDGQPIYVSEHNNSFIIKHYENINQDNFYLTAISLDKEQKLWEIKGIDLNPTFEHKKNQYTFISTEKNSNALVLNIGNEVFALSIIDGSIIWRVAL